MKIITVFSAILFLSFVSCKQQKKQLFNSNNLKSTTVTIQSNTSHLLKTSKGAYIQIEANSFDIEPGKDVAIEVKEAYNIQDMMIAGLQTKSDGKLLKSAGMIYFNATYNGQVLAFNKPIKISIPSNNWDSQMRVFSGTAGKDGVIDWTNPTAIDTNALIKNLVDGEALFKANCASCHKPTKDFTGPALALSRRRTPYPGWAYQYVNNCNEMVKTDAYAKYLMKIWGSRMTQFYLPYKDIKGILDYCDNQYIIEKRTPNTTSTAVDVATLPFPVESGELLTDCGFDTIPVSAAQIEKLPVNSILPDSFSNSDNEKYNPPVYSFSIQSSGWYNIDAFYNNINSQLTSVQLTCSSNNAALEVSDVYLIVPQKKILTNGYHEKNNYYFDKADGSIDLELNDEALILMVAEKSGQFYSGIKKFQIGASQHIVMAMKPSSKEDLMLAIRKNKLDEIKIDIEKYSIEQIIVPLDNDSNDSHTAEGIIAEMEVVKKNCIPLKDIRRKQP
jgi:mono/diheme cytochrome c family protein